MKNFRTYLLGAVVLLSLNAFAQAESMKDKDMVKKDSGKMMGEMKDNMKGDMKMDKDSKFCPVCALHGMKMKGNNNFTTEFKGKVYKFASFDHQKMFINNPEEFIKDMTMKSGMMNK